jgi:glycosyltransferase involved in cell wall biosynthesis
LHTIPTVPKLSVTIVTLNEAEHVGAALDSVSWADEVVVVDSGSRDGTCAIAEARGARVATRTWTGYVDQKNHAAQLASHDWILSLDADERITPALGDEIRQLLASEPPLRAYRAPRVAFHLGRWIRTTDFYPDYQTRLYDRRASSWRGRYVHESVATTGPVGRLRHEIEHYSFGSLAEHLDRLSLYSSLSARQMHEEGRRSSVLGLVVHPPAAFFRNYVLRRGFVDGRAGLVLSLVNAWGVFLKLAKLWEMSDVPGSGVRDRGLGTPDSKLGPRGS